MNTQPMSESVAHDMELVLTLVFHYTGEQIAEVWEKQLIPNKIVDGHRVAEEGGALVYLQSVSAEK